MKSKLSLITLFLMILASCAPQNAPVVSAPISIANAALIADAPLSEPTTVVAIATTPTLQPLQSPNGGKVQIDGMFSKNDLDFIVMRAVYNHTKNNDPVKKNIIEQTFTKIKVNGGIGKNFIYDKNGRFDFELDLGVTSLTTIQFEFVGACTIDYNLPHNALEMTPSGVKFSASCVY